MPDPTSSNSRSPRHERVGASPAVARAHYEIARNSDLRAVLPTITAPTLVVHRRDNGYYPAPLGRYLAANIPGARYVELEGADHFLWAGDVGAVLDAIEEFLTGAHGRGEPDRVLATVMFTDIVGSTVRAAEIGDHRWRGLLDTHDHLVRRQLDRACPPHPARQHPGRRPGSPGDPDRGRPRGRIRPPVQRPWQPCPQGRSRDLAAARRAGLTPAPVCPAHGGLYSQCHGSMS